MLIPNRCSERLVHQQPSHTVVQYVLAVLVSCELVRPLFPTLEHPQGCMRLLCTTLAVLRHVNSNSGRKKTVNPQAFHYATLLAVLVSCVLVRPPAGCMHCRVDAAPEDSSLFRKEGEHSCTLPDCIVLYSYSYSYSNWLS
jgi:hypothetical protein